MPATDVTPFVSRCPERVIGVLATYKRPNLLKLAIQSLKLAGIHPCVVGSEDEAREICQKARVTYTHAENSPLGAKFNVGWQKAREMDPEFILQWADDGFCEPNFLEVMGFRDFSGAQDFWMISTERRKYYFPGYEGGRRGDSIGLGRLLHRTIADQLDWYPYLETRNRGLDGSLTMRMRQIGKNTAATTNFHLSGARLLSIKTDQAITDLKMFPPGNLIEAVDDTKITNMLDQMGGWDDHLHKQP